MGKTYTAKTVNTYKELNEIAGLWTTSQISNNYVLGSNSFTITYKAQSVTFENDDLLTVASAATQYNGLGWHTLLRFNPKDYTIS